MATGTGALGLGMIDPIGGYRNPGLRKLAVTKLALIRGRNVGVALAAGDHRVVTTDAIVDDGYMIDRRRQPRLRAVANITFIDRRHVVQFLAAGDHAIVATAAHTDHLRMINRGGRYRFPGHRTALMASITNITGANVRRRPAAGGGPVMATDAGARDLIVIHLCHRHRYPFGREQVMTLVALVAAANMGRTLATGVGAIVTGDAIADKSRVINAGGRYPGGGVMAHIAFLGSGKMGGGLTRGQNPVVATAAGPDHLTMVHIGLGHGNPGDEIDVTGLANIRGRQVGRRFRGGANPHGMAQHAIIDYGQLVMGKGGR